MPCYCGIDIGASSAKLVLIDAEGRKLAHAVRHSGVDYAHTAELCLNEALAGAGLERSAMCAAISTGYGRDNVPWAQDTMTEIACHGRGAYAHFPGAISVIDIGDQDSKMIHLDAEGRRLGFKMNRKCAAGTGAFLEEIAHRLGLDASELNELAERSTEQVTLGSFCTVFAATEILEKIRAGKHVEDIVRGAFSSVVKRIVEMDYPQGQLVMTGGVVAYNPLLTRLMGEAFGQPVHVPAEPQLVGALGAALFALEKTDKGN